jgi:hypothetical protein
MCRPDTERAPNAIQPVSGSSLARFGAFATTSHAWLRLRRPTGVALDESRGSTDLQAAYTGLTRRQI